MHFRAPFWTLMPGFVSQLPTNTLGARPISKWRSSLSLVDNLPTTLVCLVCGKGVALKGMGSHLARAHQHFRVAWLHCREDGVCPVCGISCPSRLRCVHHIHHSTFACLQAVQYGRIPPLDEALVQPLDKADAFSRKMALKSGLYLLAFGANI